MKKILLTCFTFLFASSLVTSCNKKDEFTYWNDCNSLTVLKDYVKDVTNEKSDNFIPVSDRIAVFDMDGTLYGELDPGYLEYTMYAYRVLEDTTFKGTKTDEMISLANTIKEAQKGFANPSGTDLEHAKCAAKAYAGMTVAEFDNYTKEFLKKNAVGFTNMTYNEAFYKPMVEVVNYLIDNKFDVYVVSGSDRYLCRTLICNNLNIGTNKIIGMDVLLEGTKQDGADGRTYQFNKDEDLVRTDTLLFKNLKTNKVLRIQEEIGKKPVLSFGNSSGDSSMHNFTISNNKYKAAAFMLVADDRERDYGVSDEKIAELNASWTSAGYNVISMKNDFKTIYGYDVKKTN